MRLFKQLMLCSILLCCTRTMQSQTLFINEIMSDNIANEMDEFFEYDDWVEIYNSGGVLNLGGYYVSDDPALLTKWQIPTNDPTGTFMLPNSHLILWCDRDPEQGATHIDFNLSVDGETFILTAPDGITVVDSITFGQQASDVSYGRSCDGCSDWIFFNTPTFDATNADTEPTDALAFINEVQYNNSTYYHDLNFDYDPWIEIYNPNPTQINLAGFTIQYNGNDWLLPSNDPFRTVIAPNGFGIFWLDGEPSEGTHHSPVAVSPGNTLYKLIGPSGAVIDQIAVPTAQNNHSYGRQSDGSVNWINFPIPTPAVSNSTIAVSSPPLFINELMAANLTDTLDGTGTPEDWFEIYNPNSFPVYLGGYYISDNLENPTKWQVPVDFPDSVTVPANGWLLFWADNDAGQGVLHTTYMLSNNGEYLGIFTPDGFTRVDEIAWSVIGADTSYGRHFDGSNEWIFFTGTTPEYSNNQGVVNINETSTSDLRAYPNPCTEMLYLSNKINSARIYTAQGQWVQSLANTQTIDFTSLPKGLYYVVTSEQQVLKIIKP